MIVDLRAVDLLGIFVEPAIICLLAALAITYGVRRILDWLDVDRLVWNRALFDLSILVSATALLILALRVPGS